MCFIDGKLAAKTKTQLKIMDTKIHQGAFGSCCQELADCLDIPNSSFRHEENDVWYLTVGHIQTEHGPGFFDQAIIFCPFCGKQLQDPKEIALKPLPE